MKFLFPEVGYLRLSQILGQKGVSEEQAAENRKSQKSPKTSREEIVPIIPISKSTWWKGIREGRFPSPVKLGSRTICWRVEDIRRLLEREE